MVCGPMLGLALCRAYLSSVLLAGQIGSVTPSRQSPCLLTLPDVAALHLSTAPLPSGTDRYLARLPSRFSFCPRAPPKSHLTLGASQWSYCRSPCPLHSPAWASIASPHLLHGRGPRPRPSASGHRRSPHPWAPAGTSLSLTPDPKVHCGPSLWPTRALAVPPLTFCFRQPTQGRPQLDCPRVHRFLQAFLAPSDRLLPGLHTRQTSPLLHVPSEPPASRPGSHSLRHGPGRQAYVGPPPNSLAGCRVLPWSPLCQSSLSPGPSPWPASST
ncbi:hypothetical protein NDU88_001029 [Pleurodeles waltl]|uniref:Uncharacterized protein n=1 Tax=Pleurodeles waltl TaxID=8319 RepID=A0AAV7V717_PLEWA|nr:hypothetical protein NDU88_001029 [Pleurodeles waltl]